MSLLYIIRPAKCLIVFARNFLSIMFLCNLKSNFVYFFFVSYQKLLRKSKWTWLMYVHLIYIHMILYFFPGPNYPLVCQKILHRKICLQVCILFSLYFADCSINTGSGGSNIYQVRMLSKFQYIIWRVFLWIFCKDFTTIFHKMSNSHLTSFLQIEEYNYISNGV